MFQIQRKRKQKKLMLYLCKNSTEKKREEGIKEGEGDRKNSSMQRKDAVYILEEDTPRNRKKY